jgi:hypothetical protein
MVANALLNAVRQPLHADALILLAAITPRDVGTLLGDLASNPAFLPWSAERSHRHTLGFDKLVLAETSGGARLRLHLWHPGKPFEKFGDIHDHEWDYSSLVLYGSLFARQHKIVSSTKGALFHRFSVQSGYEGHKKLIYGGKEFVVASDVAEIRARSVHYLEAGLFHSANCKEETLTLFLQGPRKGKASTVFRHSPPSGNVEETPVKHFTADAFVDIINYIKTRLS